MRRRTRSFAPACAALEARTVLDGTIGPAPLPPPPPAPAPIVAPLPNPMPGGLVPTAPVASVTTVFDSGPSLDPGDPTPELASSAVRYGNTVIAPADMAFDSSAWTFVAQIADWETGAIENIWEATNPDWVSSDPNAGDWTPEPPQTLYATIETTPGVPLPYFGTPSVTPPYPLSLANSVPRNYTFYATVADWSTGQTWEIYAVLPSSH